MIHDALSETIILLVISVIAVAIFRRIKLPAILAYLTVGIVLGPHATGLMINTDTIRVLAEVGIAFLLFSLGLEFSLPKLIANRKAVLGLGSAQVTVTILIAGGISWFLGTSIETAFVIGCALALSSTAIVVKQLSEKLELNSRHGRLSIAILLYQDIAVIPMLIIIPALTGSGNEPFALQIVYSFAEGIAVTAIMLAIGHWLLRPLFHEIASAHSAELFTLTVLLIALTSAWATHHAGLSMALGTFLAGMMLSETEFRHQIEADIRPFRDVLLGLFFVTVGMLLNISNLLPILHWVLLIAIAIIIGKTLITLFMSKFICKASNGVSLRTGIVLAQGGEFGFAILSLALAAGLIDDQLSQLMLASVIFSMLLTPFLIRYNGSAAKYFFANSYLRNRKEIEEDITDSAASMNKHVIICGFGRMGQNIAKVLEQENFDYFALDYDSSLLNNARKAGLKVFFGDSTHHEILTAAGISRACVLIICHDDIKTTEKTLTQAKALNANIPVLVRTQDDSYYDILQKAGATEVIPETLEASLIMASHLLSLMGIPMSKIVRRVQEMRSNNYSALRQFYQGEEKNDIEKPDDSRKRLISIVLHEGAYAIGKTLSEIDLKKTGANIHTNRRSGSYSQPPTSETLLKEDDILVLFGTPECLVRAEALLLNG
jgi:monovalent cation:H+ antiporter-2, CPA2 family